MKEGKNASPQPHPNHSASPKPPGLHILEIRLWHVPDIDPKTDPPQINAILHEIKRFKT
jgi:hypothetical protein